MLSSILRIDVDHRDPGKAYAVPKDNPFVGLADVRPEIWSFGFRNPWKMSFDRGSGDLWVGDVGWEMWEMIYKVKKGGNYGWAIKEGPQTIKPDWKPGPTPILPPTVAFPHTEAASITGGFVYRGKKYPELAGSYVCGDWMSRKFWATRMDGDKVVSHREIAQGKEKIITFAEDPDGELYYVDYHDTDGGIYALVPNEAAHRPQPKFPTRLSETGLFADLKSMTPAEGVYAYSINAEPWADDAAAERWAAFPGVSSARIFRKPTPVPGTAWFKAVTFLPSDGVLVKTLSIATEQGNQASRRRMETQILHFDGSETRGYTYRWNAEQSDAELVPKEGADVELTIRDAAAPGGSRRQTWHFPSRTECRQCHNPWAGETLSFREEQLMSPGDGRKRPGRGLDELMQLGLIVRGSEDVKPSEDRPPTPLIDPHGPAELSARARSYLHVNCAHCHQFGGGGSVDLELKHDIGLDQMKVLEAKPAQGTFDIPECRIVAPGDPYRSVLYYRMAKEGRGRMPHVGSERVDPRGTALIRDWIRTLPLRKDDRALVEVAARRDGNGDEKERAQAIDRLLSSPATALMLLEAWEAGRLTEKTRAKVLAVAATREVPVRDLFERFIPDAERVKRLGTLIRPESLLSGPGKAESGKGVFFAKNGARCADCHRVGKEGGEIGPELTRIGAKLSKRQLLESILDPSKDIEAKFAAYRVETIDGKVHNGLIVARSADRLTVRSNDGKDAELLLKNVVSQTPSTKSLMPDHLLRDLTAEQARDLLAYLESLR